MQVTAHRVYEIELLLTLVSVLLAFLRPGASQILFGVLLRGARRLARSPRVSLLLVAALPLVLRFLLLPWIPAPQPQIQEEFSNLLGADTLAHGRLANPQHPMAIFFDNIQEIQTPHYASARPPGEAIFLWIGEVLFHFPWLGVCLSVSLMCAAFYWMLRGWTKPEWALVTAVLVALRFGVFTYWMNSYWGGAGIAFGGALILGALPRLIYGRNATGTLDHRRILPALLYALGCAILAATRPYEGLAYVLPTAAALAAWWARSPDKAARHSRFAQTLFPIAAVLAIFLVWLGYYNFAQTGDPFLPAYRLWRNQQGVVPTFWWQPLRKALPVYYSAQTREFHEIWEVSIYHALHRSIHAGILTMSWRIAAFLHLYLRPLLLLPFLAGIAGIQMRRKEPGARRRFSDWGWDWLWLSSVPALLLAFSPTGSIFILLWAAGWVLFWRSRRHGLPRNARIVVAVLAAGVVCAVLTNFSMPTYYAHFTAPAFILVALGMRSLADWRRRQRTGRAIVANLSLSCCLMFVICAALAMLHVQVIHEWPFNWSGYENRLMDRVKVEKFLNQQPGGQLAIVRYGPQHDVLFEWVWNGADIDRQNIVWARELRPEWTADLAHYYAGRKIWLVEADSGVVCPYPVAGLPAAGTPLPSLTYK